MNETQQRKNRFDKIQFKCVILSLIKIGLVVG